MKNSYRPEENVEQAQQEAAKQLHMERRLARAKPAEPSNRSPEKTEAIRVHKTPDAVFEELDKAKEIVELSNKRGDGGGKAISDMHQRNVEGIVGERPSYQSLDQEFPGRVFVPRSSWKLSDFGMEESAGHRQLNPDKLVVSEPHGGLSEDQLRAAAQDGETVFELIGDDKAFRFKGLESKLDHVQLNKQLNSQLERVRRGEIQPSAVISTDKLVDVALKYEKFPGLSSDAPIRIYVPKDVHSRMCYVDGNDRVQNRLEDYIQRRAGERGLADPNRVEVHPMEKTTYEIGSLAEFAREGMVFSPQEAQLKAQEVRDTVNRICIEVAAENVGQFKRQMIEPRVAWNMSVGKEGAFLVDSAGKHHEMFRLEELPEQVRRSLGELGELRMENAGEYISFPEAHQSVQDIRQLIEPIAAEGRPATDNELAKIRSAAKGRLGFEESELYLEDSSGFRHTIFRFSEGQSPIFRRLYVKA